MKKYVFCLMVGFLTLLLASCGEILEPAKYIEAFEKSKNSVTEVVQNTEIYDDEMLISNEKLTIQKDVNKGITKVQVYSRVLAPINSEDLYEVKEFTIYYTISAKYSNESGSWVKEDGVFASEVKGINCKIDYLDVVSYDKNIKIKNTLIANVKSDNVSNFLNKSVSANNVKMSMTISDKKKLISFNVDYVTDNNNKVAITNTYGYNTFEFSEPII